MLKRTSKRWAVRLASLFMALALLASVSTASALDDAAVNETEVSTATAGGVAYLLTQQGVGLVAPLLGCWTSQGVIVGITALAMLAIINANLSGYSGLSATETTAIDAGTACLLTSVKGDGSIHDGFLETYSTSIATWALSEVDQTNVAVPPAWAGGRAWLLTHQVDNGALGVIDDLLHDGGWTYGGNTVSGFTEHSNSSFALQGLATTGGVPTSGGNTGNPAAFAESFFTCLQNRLPSCGDQTSLDGGFIYSHQLTKGGSRTSQTASGIFALRLAGVSSADGRIVDGLAFLDESLSQNPGANMLHNDAGTVEPLDALHWSAEFDLVHYTVWAVTKAYELSGVTDDVTDPSNWFYKIANFLVHEQNGDGSWPVSSREDQILATSFAMLTLERVTPPTQDEPVTCTKGFWKNHVQGVWVNLDPDVEPEWGGTATYLELLNTPPKKGDASVKLAHAFITATLNTGVDATLLDDAECCTPGTLAPSKPRTLPRPGPSPSAWRQSSKSSMRVSPALCSKER